MTAIIDSCIGGKTAINYNNIINSVGTYYHPKSVFIFKNIIDNLPEREFLAGIPEIIKCGLIKKSNILKDLKKNHLDIKKRDFKLLKKIIYETLKVKIFFFKNDIYEKNTRLNLNFGHTFGHAMEWLQIN
jgi:3-dehydroquinate synthase